MYLSVKSVNLSGGKVPACHYGVKCNKPLNKDAGGGRSNFKIMYVFHTYPPQGEGRGGEGGGEGVKG